MKLFPLASCLFIFSLLLFGCSSDNKEDNSEESQKPAEVSTAINHTGFNSVKELTQSVIETIKNKDYENYITHVMSREEELGQSRRIEDDSLRQAFIDEFSFSLHEEEDYFNNMIKYLHDTEINLDRSIVEESIVIDYEDNKYAPCEIVEVIIPIEHEESEIDLVYVGIKIGQKWFLTAELGI